MHKKDSKNSSSKMLVYASILTLILAICHILNNRMVGKPNIIFGILITVIGSIIVYCLYSWAKYLK